VFSPLHTESIAGTH